MTAIVESTRSGNRTDYTVIGTRDEVEEAIDRILANYHPLGYGTTFNPPRPADASGIITAHGYRYNSCD
jgi:hypothetical protein